MGAGQPDGLRRERAKFRAPQRFSVGRRGPIAYSHTERAVSGRYLMFGFDFFIYIIVAIFYILTTGRLPFSG